MQKLKKGAADFERFRLRRLVERLREAGEVEVHDGPVDLVDVARHLDGNPKVQLFRKAGPEGAELVGNVMGSRRRIAYALGCEEGALLATIIERLRQPIAPLEVAPGEAPVQEVVLEGEDADFTRLPIHLQHAYDGGPYLSASMDFAVNPETGWTNVGVRRHMLRGRRQSNIDLVSPSDLRAIYLARLEEKKPLAVSYVVGTHPADFIGATSLRPPTDEIGLLGAVRGAAVPVVKCVTNDVYVPADAEYVLEGYFDERGYAEIEGPFGEFLGYYGPPHINPTFHLTAVTHRKDALFQTVTQGGRSMQHTDTAHIACLRTESSVWAALENAVREPRAIYVTPACGGTFNVRIAMRPRYPGEARNAIAAAFASFGDVKHVFVVDDDVDVFSDDQMDWALSTRFQADRDLVVMEDIRAYPLDPSLYGSRTGSKAGFDLTIPYGVDRGPGFTVAEPPVVARGGRLGVRAALEEGPKRFVEILAATGSRDGREVVVALEELRAAGELTRLEDGRYGLTE